MIVPLFHPRKDHWLHHFALSVEKGSHDAVDVNGLTPEGRTTVLVLGMNDQMRRILRYELWRERLFVW